MKRILPVSILTLAVIGLIYAIASADGDRNGHSVETLEVTGEDAAWASNTTIWKFKLPNDPDIGGIQLVVINQEGQHTHESSQTIDLKGFKQASDRVVRVSLKAENNSLEGNFGIMFDNGATASAYQFDEAFNASILTNPPSRIGDYFLFSGANNIPTISLDSIEDRAFALRIVREKELIKNGLKDFRGFIELNTEKFIAKQQDKAEVKPSD